MARRVHTIVSTPKRLDAEAFSPDDASPICAAPIPIITRGAMIDDVDRATGQPASPSPDESLGYCQCSLLPRKPASVPGRFPCSELACSQPARFPDHVHMRHSPDSIMGGEQHATRRSPQTSPAPIV